MSITQGDGGSGGGTSTQGGICWVDPADQQAFQNDIITRLEKVEAALSILLGTDFSALSLNEISSSSGLLTDMQAVLANAAGGWITDGTFTGVAISSLGWVMSDGSTFPIVTMVDGVLQFGFGSDGMPGGALVDQWNAAAAAVSGGGWTGIPAYAEIGWHNNASMSSITKNITVQSRTRGAGIGTIKATGMAPGKYIAFGNATNYIDTGGTVGAVTNGYLTLGVVGQQLAIADTSGVIASGGFARLAASVSTIFNITSTSQEIVLGWQCGILGGSCTFLNPYEFSLQIMGLGA